MNYSYTQISQYLTCPRRYRYRYLEGWKQKDNRAVMLFGRAFEHALGALFRREDPGEVFFREWSACKNESLEFSGRDSWDRMLEQGIMLLTRFCQDNRIRIRQPRRNLQIKVFRHLAGTNCFVAYVDAIGDLDGARCLLEWKTSFRPVSRGTGRTAGSRPPACLLLVDDGHLRSCPDCFCPQAPGGSSVPAHHHHRGAASGIRPAGRRHNSPYSIRPVPASQRHTFPAESVQQVSLCGVLSRTTGSCRVRSGAEPWSKRPWLD